MSVTTDPNTCDHKVPGRKLGVPCPSCGKVLPPELPGPAEYMYDAGNRKKTS